MRCLLADLVNRISLPRVLSDTMSPVKGGRCRSAGVGHRSNRAGHRSGRDAAAEAAAARAGAQVAPVPPGAQAPVLGRFESSRARIGFKGRPEPFCVIERPIQGRVTSPESQNVTVRVRPESARNRERRSPRSASRTRFLGGARKITRLSTSSATRGSDYSVIVRWKPEDATIRTRCRGIETPIGDHVGATVSAS